MMIPARGGKRLIYSGGYRQAKQKIAKYLAENYKHIESVFSDHPEFYYTKVRYVVYDNWLTKSSKYRKLRKKDVANYQKNVEDVVYKFVGLDDSSIIDSYICKRLLKPDESVAQIDVTIDLYELVDKKCLME